MYKIKYNITDFQKQGGTMNSSVNFNTDISSYDINTKIDLHIHTTASDGTWSPEELIEKLEEKDIQIFSVTDHDTIDNITKISRLAEYKNLLFIPGVEISSLSGNNYYHILCYNFDTKNQKLLKILKQNTLMLDERDDSSIEFLENKGMNVSFSEYMSYRNNRQRGGWKALNYAMDKGLCSDYKDFFKLFSKLGLSFEMPRFPSPKEVIDTVKKAGGIPVLAHPGAEFYPDNYRHVLDFFLNKGIMGIECYHPENSPDITKYCMDFCRNTKLLITGGSDCHGDFVRTRKLGYPKITLEMLKLGKIL